jgi:hypothetical protein
MTLGVTYTTAGDPARALEVTKIPDPPAPEHGHVQIEVRAFSGADRESWRGKGDTGEVAAELAVPVPDSVSDGVAAIVKT